MPESGTGGFAPPSLAFHLGASVGMWGEWNVRPIEAAVLGHPLCERAALLIAARLRGGGGGAHLPRVAHPGHGADA